MVTPTQLRDSLERGAAFGDLMTAAAVDIPNGHRSPDDRDFLGGIYHLLYSNNAASFNKGVGHLIFRLQQHGGEPTIAGILTELNEIIVLGADEGVDPAAITALRSEVGDTSTSVGFNSAAEKLEKQYRSTPKPLLAKKLKLLAIIPKLERLYLTLKVMFTTESSTFLDALYKDALTAKQQEIIARTKLEKIRNPQAVSPTAFQEYKKFDGEASSELFSNQTAAPKAASHEEVQARELAYLEAKLKALEAEVQFNHVLFEAFTIMDKQSIPDDFQSRYGKFESVKRTYKSVMGSRTLSTPSGSGAIRTQDRFPVEVEDVKARRTASKQSYVAVALAYYPSHPEQLTAAIRVVQTELDAIGDGVPNKALLLPAQRMRVLQEAAVRAIEADSSNNSLESLGIKDSRSLMQAQQSRVRHALSNPATVNPLIAQCRALEEKILKEEQSDDGLPQLITLGTAVTHPYPEQQASAPVEPSESVAQGIPAAQGIPVVQGIPVDAVSRDHTNDDARQRADIAMSIHEDIAKAATPNDIAAVKARVQNELPQRKVPKIVDALVNLIADAAIRLWNMAKTKSLTAPTNRQPFLCSTTAREAFNSIETAEQSNPALRVSV